MGEWPQEWLAAAKNLRAGTLRSYSSHIRLYYQPHIGHIRIDRLRVADVASVFDAIDKTNAAITESRPGIEPARRAPHDRCTRRISSTTASARRSI